MKILSAKQTQKVDQFTIDNEPIKSIDLMERASNAFIDTFINQVSPRNKIAIVAGRGNNGGDGLAIARLLIQRNYDVTTYIIEPGKEGSDDFETNRKRLEKLIEINGIGEEADIPEFTKVDIIVDAIFGSGLSRPVEGLYASIINAMNNSSALIYAVDISSGLFADKITEEGAVVNADYTLTFQLPKLALLLPQNFKYVGEWEALDIGLNTEFIQEQITDYEYISKSLVTSLIKLNSKFDHKGTNGRAVLVSGSYGKMGAAILSSRASLRAGLGLLTIHAPKCGYEILQSSVPEAMVSIDVGDHFISNTPELENIDAVGLGPGIGLENKTISSTRDVLKNFDKSMVIDADALNIISKHRELLEIIPAGSILTPHPKEFERLVGSFQNDFERLKKQKELAARYHMIVLVKGPHTSIATPDGKVYFNSTGNPGMATGGSGDVLTGILTALLAQGYSSQDAALLGVYIHGLAGDFAEEIKGKNGMIASDIIDCIPQAINSLKQ